MRLLLSTLRAKQWLKNILVFTALFFSGGLLTHELFWSASLTFIAFSIMASSVYIMNDIIDRESDKFHPKKKYRPIASGRISLPLARTLWAWLSMIGLLIGYSLGYGVMWVLIGYFVLNIIYSFVLKARPIADIVTVALMYYLRVLAGAIAIGVTPSPWIFITVFFWALFLITAKRCGELSHSAETKKRKVLEHYSIDFLHMVFVLSMGISFIAYALYTIEKGGLLYLSILPILYAYLKYAQLVVGEAHKVEEPESIVIHDWEILLSGLIWGIAVFSHVYY